MDLDERIINYMKVRNEYAKMAARVAASLLFALAGFLCVYALYVGGAVLSGSTATVRLIIIVFAIVIFAALSLTGVMCCRKLRKVYIRYPDSISIRQSEDVIREAYTISRPVLVHKITLFLLLLPASGLVYIMLLIFLEDTPLAGIYGDVAVCLYVGLFIAFAMPCIDRIHCYRTLLNEIHTSVECTDESYIKRRIVQGSIFAVAAPVTICVWYLIKYYGPLRELAWMTFPIASLLVLALVFLVGWTME